MPKIIRFNEYTMFFESPDEKYRSVGMITQDKYSAYYHIFNPYLFEGKKGDEMVHVLETAIITMLRVYRESGVYYTGIEGMMRWSPYCYVEILKAVREYATACPTWIFRCERRR
jgi:hypothetical protein